MKNLFLIVTIGLLACNSGEPVTSTESSDSAIKAIDPKGNIRDTSQYPIDTAAKDSITTGVTH